jgi:hypothetical protein
LACTAGCLDRLGQPGAGSYCNDRICGSRRSWNKGSCVWLSNRDHMTYYAVKIRQRYPIGVLDSPPMERDGCPASSCVHWPGRTKWKQCNQIPEDFHPMSFRASFGHNTNGERFCLSLSASPTSAFAGLENRLAETRQFLAVLSTSVQMPVCEELGSIALEPQSKLLTRRFARSVPRSVGDEGVRADRELQREHHGAGRHLPSRPGLARLVCEGRRGRRGPPLHRHRVRGAGGLPDCPSVHLSVRPSVCLSCRPLPPVCLSVCLPCRPSPLASWLWWKLPLLAVESICSLVLRARARAHDKMFVTRSAASNHRRDRQIYSGAGAARTGGMRSRLCPSRAHVQQGDELGRRRADKARSC